MSNGAIVSARREQGKTLTAIKREIAASDSPSKMRRIFVSQGLLGDASTKQKAVKKPKSTPVAAAPDKKKGKK